jgi:hypothetical protein
VHALVLNKVNTIPCYTQCIVSHQISVHKIQQDRQCTQNVTLRRVRATTVAVAKQQALHILCVLFVALGIQQACRRHIVMWPVRLYDVFPRCLTNGKIFGGGELLHANVYFDLLYNFCLKNFSLYEEMGEIQSQCILVYM